MLARGASPRHVKWDTCLEGVEIAQLRRFRTSQGCKFFAALTQADEKKFAHTMHGSFRCL